MVHLGYCTNVHPGESLAEVERSLDRIAARVRARLGLPSLGLGLWLSRRAALEVDPPRLADRLDRAGLHCFTLNGFPYGDFHGPSVKARVYRPDWTSPDRAEHTLRLASVLDAIAPAGVACPTISTVPLGFRLGWDAAATDTAARALVRVARQLASKAQREARAIRVCLEPEPGCVLERSTDVVRFFEGPLARAAGPDEALVREHLGVCWDTCHLAVAFEDPAAILAGLSGAGIAIGKVQVSSAVELREPADESARKRLRALDEPRYLHQVRTAAGQGTDDLPEALDTLPRDRPWRVHFHSPIDRDDSGALGTTRADLERALVTIGTATQQFEVETYTWTVLPPGDRPEGDGGLAEGIAREVAWARARLAIQ